GEGGGRGADARRRDRRGERIAFRLRRESSGSGRGPREHALPPLPRSARRAVRLLHPAVPVDRERYVSRLRHDDSGALGDAIRGADHRVTLRSRVETLSRDLIAGRYVDCPWHDMLPHRLRRASEFSYIGRHRYSLTFCAFQRRSLFTDADLANAIVA